MIIYISREEKQTTFLLNSHCHCQYSLKLWPLPLIYLVFSLLIDNILSSI